MRSHQEAAMRALISCVLVVLLPAALWAADTPSPGPAAGVVYGTGSVYLDGAQLANSMPVMTGDIVETKDTSTAHIDMSGSTAIVQANAIVRLKDGGVALDRGHIAMATAKSIRVYARDFEITPTSTDWTQYEVVRSAGLIHISALKRDVEIKCGAEKPTIVREGHEITRVDAQNCGLAARTSAGAPTAATGPLLTSPWAEGAGLATAGGLIGWTLAHGDNPLSPDRP
jgi:hypothetical protein